MVGVKVEHVLILVIAAFMLYHLVGKCGCTNGLVDGFSVGIETSSTIPSNCTTTLNNLCSASKQEGSEKCGVCVENNQHKLLMAGCTASMVDSFCSNSCPFGEKCFVKGGNIETPEKTGCRNMKNASDCEKAWACVYGYEDNKEVCKLNKGNSCTWVNNKCEMGGNQKLITNCSFSNECPESLPQCPIDPVAGPDHAYPFVYNPGCKYNFGKIDKTYTFDGKDYYICKGVNELGQKCRPTEGQIIPYCNTAFARVTGDPHGECNSGEYIGEDCNNRYQMVDFTLKGDYRKANCNTNRMYTPSSKFKCEYQKNSGVLDWGCMDYYRRDPKNTTDCGGAGSSKTNPKFRDKGVPNWCYDPDEE